MFIIDNSQISWLVYADWLEDQGIDASHIRNFETDLTNQWIYEEDVNLFYTTNNGNYVGTRDYSLIMENQNPVQELAGISWLLNYEVGTSDFMDDNVGNISIRIMPIPMPFGDT